MAIQMFAGGETGDTAEITVSGTVAITSAQFASGAYSYEVNPTTTNTGSFILKNGLSAQIKYCHFNFRAHTLPASNSEIIMDDANGILELRLNSNGTLAFYQSTTLLATGTVIISADTWYEFQVFMEEDGVSANQLVVVNGTTDISLSRNPNQAASTFRYGKTVNRNGNSVDFFYDNIIEDTAAFPQLGSKVIARQVTANGNYNTWTYSTGTTLTGVICKTPNSGSTTNVNTGTAANKFSGTLNFASTSGTGNSGHGTEIVGANDTIVGLKIGAYGQTSSTSSDGADSTIFRTPSGAGGSDTLTALAVWTTTAAPGTYLNVLLASAPTAAQILNCEIGLSKGTGVRTHSCYDLWAILDYVPSPSLDASLIFNDYSPWDDEDDGDEPPWYTDNSEYTAALVWAQMPSVIVLEAPMRSIVDLGDSPDYNPALDVDTSVIVTLQTLIPDLVINDYEPELNEILFEDLGDEQAWYIPSSEELMAVISSQQLSILIIDTPMRSFGEASDGSDYDSYNDEAAAISLVTSTFNAALIILDYSPDPWANDDTSDSGEYDFQDDQTILQFIIYTELFVENDYAPLELDQLIDDLSEGDYYPDFSIDPSPSYFGTQTLLMFNDYEPELNEVLFDDLGDEQSWYAPFADDSAILFGQQLSDAFGLHGDYSPEPWVDDDTGEEPGWYTAQDTDASLVNVTIYVELFVENDYTPSDYEELIEDAEGDFYPDFSIEISWFLPIVTENFIFIDYAPSDTEQLIEDDGSEQSWYPPQDEYTMTWIASQVNQIIVLEAPMRLVTDAGEAGDYDPYNDEAAIIITISPTTIDPSLVEIDYAPLELEQFDEDIGFSSSTSSYAIVFGINENFIFNDYTPWETETATDDLGDNGEYDPLYDNIESWYLTFSQLIVENPFIDYLELYADDSSNSGEYDLPSEELLQWFIPPPVVVYLIFNDYTPLELEQLIEESEGDFYPDFSIDLSFFLPIVTENFIFNDYSPLELEQLIEDEGSDQAWYPPQDELLSWFIPSPAITILIFNDYVPNDIDQLTEDAAEGDYYPDFSIDLSFFLPIVTEIFVFSESVPDAELVDFTQVSIDVIINTTTPEILVFIDYVPSDNEELIEESESDYYPPFWDDSAILFAQDLFPFNTLEFEWKSIDTPEIQTEDQGDEDTWYGPFGSIDWVVTFFVPPIPVENLIASDQNASYAIPDPFLLNDDSDLDSWYGPLPDNMDVLFFAIPIATVNLVFLDYSPDDFDSYDENIGFQSSASTYSIVFGASANFIFNDYTPLELEQLIEESEGDFYPDFSIDISWFTPITIETFVFNDYSPKDFDFYDESIGFTSPSSYSLIFGANENFIFNDYSPLEIETLSEESEGDYYPDFSIDLSFFLPIVTEVFVFNDYEPELTEVLFDDLGDEQAWYPPIDTDAVIVSHIIVIELFVENDYAPLELETLTEESEGDYYPDFSIDNSWYFALAPGVPASFVFEDYSPRDTEQLIEDNGSEESWYYGLWYLAIVQVSVYLLPVYIPVFEQIQLYTTLAETDSETGRQTLILYFPLQGAPGSGNVVGTS